VTDLCMGVFGDVRSGSLLLTEYDAVTQGYSEGHVLLCRAKGYLFAGTFSVTANGTSCVICSPGQDAYELMAAAIPVFVAYAAAKKQVAVDGVDWLEKLHALQDTKVN
jgi:hypothetical protein